MQIVFKPLNTAAVRTLQAGGADAYGHMPERRVSDGDQIPCRHCLGFVPEGEGYLIIAHRPFDSLHPYTETGPIFLCAKSCEPGGGGDALPEVLYSPSYILRGYGADERIIYGTGAVVETSGISDRAKDLLARDDVAFVHVRSSSNNCFHCRIERA